MFRFAILVAPLFALAVTGCAPGKLDIEKSVKAEMNTSLGTEITAIDLAKQSDGGYAGTATAANGNTYDVTTTAPSSGRFEWKAVPAQSTVESMVREHLKKALAVDVSALDLKKQPDGGYTGTATTVRADTYEVAVGAPTKEQGIVLNATPGQSTVERLVREGIEAQMKTKIKSFALTRRAPGTYTGTATLEKGPALSISTTMEGQNLTWKIEPRPAR
ncbi:hypothetical protein J8F10_34765 [Gemmata sp. G18]|uniref:Lipoprotein n=1 Tax=Gemmata palustris TaxID=2822762 RepID=A0ABS5C5P9_9BACT|nr:hypothetical protein [Gemmata palustris]MBP3960418.1 hypothetical protein [Gemmata palustris]